MGGVGDQPGRAGEHVCLHAGMRDCSGKGAAADGASWAGTQALQDDRQEAGDSGGGGSVCSAAGVCAAGDPGAASHQGGADVSVAGNAVGVWIHDGVWAGGGGAAVSSEEGGAALGGRSGDRDCGGGGFTGGGGGGGGSAAAGAVFVSAVYLRGLYGFGDGLVGCGVEAAC